MINQEPEKNVKGVTLVISSLECGGAERVLKNMTDFWVKQGRPVTVITLFTKELDFFVLDEKVTRIDLGLTNKKFSLMPALFNVLRVASKLRKSIKTANNRFVISFLCRTNVLTLLVTRFMSAKIIVTEHTDPTQRQLGGIINHMRKALYPKASAVVVLTENVKTNWADKFLDPAKAKVIPNPIVKPDEIDAALSFELPPRYIVTMGRMISDKGHLLLLKAFVKVSKEFPGLSLVVLGDGPERSRLEKEIESYGLVDRVVLPGRIHNIAPVMKGAECFVLSSLREGFPLAMAEAMNLGLVPVSFNCPSGPAEIIRDGVDGILVPMGDTDALASAVSELLNDPDRRKEMGLLAEEGISDRFSVSVVMRQWDDLLASCAEEES